jgi:hypothetical protein
MRDVMIFLIKFIGSIIATIVLVPLVIVICFPYLLLVSLVDREEYWSSFWWRTKRLAAATADITGIIGASAAS